MGRRAKQDSLSFAVAREEKAEGRHIQTTEPAWVGRWLMGVHQVDHLKPFGMDKFPGVVAAAPGGF